MHRGHNPNPLFDVDWYFSLRPEVRRAGENPVFHYHQYWRLELHDPHPDFYNSWYVAQCPEIEASSVSPLAHYLRHGRRRNVPMPPPRQEYRLLRLENFRERIILPIAKVRHSIPCTWPAGAGYKGTARNVHLAEVEVPAVYLAEVPRAIVRGRTNFLFTDSEAICHDLYDFRFDYTNEEKTHRATLDHRASRLTWTLMEKPRGRLAEAICCTDSLSSNYAHWLTEVLPRIALLDQIPEAAHLPLLIDGNLHPNILESLHMVAEGKVSRIIPLAATDEYAVDRCYVISPPGYLPFEWRTRPDDISTRLGYFHPEAIRVLRGMVSKATAGISPAGPKKIYLRRNSQVRKVTNGQEIEAMLVREGFAAIAPEELGFLEQARLFANAEVIVGSSGAALANIIFCEPGARVVVLTGEHPDMIYGYWQALAASAGNRVHFVLGPQEGLQRSIHSNFSVNGADVIAALAASR